MKENKIITVRGEKYISVKLNMDMVLIIKEHYPNHGRPECHFCDFKYGGLCSEASEIIYETGGCVGMDKNEDDTYFLALSTCA